MNMFDINIVIVNYNMKDMIDRCLSSLFLDVQKSGLKICVTIVDNDSHDGSGDFLKTKHPEVRYIQLPDNKGFGAAQNIGLKSVEAKYNFVLNPDTYFFPDENVLRKLFDFMEHEPKIGIAGPKIIYPDGSLQYSCYRFPMLWQPLFSRTGLGRRRKGKKIHDYLIMKDFDHSEKRAVDWLMGSALFIRNSFLQKVGYFDERFFMYYEDSDLCRRFWEAGFPVYYFPDAKIEHIHLRRSAETPGVLSSILKNKLARVHIYSWVMYMWKWRGNLKYYNP